MSTETKLRALAERWSDARSAERANFQTYLIELCESLGVERPRPAGSGYEFELPIRIVNRDGTEAQNFVDLYKEGHFVLEAKHPDDGRANDLVMRKAFGQARTYAAYIPGGVAPPYLMVLDVGATLLVWDRWSGGYGGYNAAKRIDLRTLADRPDDIALLRDIWENPAARDPRLRATAVTKEIAGRLGELAAALEDRGFDQERVARFLIRCVFTMFAEDVHLLPDESFRQVIEVALASPGEFVPAAEELWRAMDEGRRFGIRRLLRFNGHFFRDAEALDLTRGDLALLLEASRADWSKVEPTIFGTLLVRALDPVERHRLGAEFTPREFVERLARPTIEEPIRERWTAVQAEVLQLRESGKKKDQATAEARLRDFHAWLRNLSVLDPACGSGNFLYVALHTIKRVELEVMRAIEDVTGQHALRFDEVGPWQFHGIEVKPWSREIAELTLWIGFHQFWRQHHDVQPEEPILRDTGTLELRDAVLAWDSVTRDQTRDRRDPTPRVRHPVTGELVPDPDAILEYREFVNPREAEWPDVDFIIGNPPYLGQARQREVFGDGYVDALRAAYPNLPDTADYVMYWWDRSARAVASGRTIRAGLITTQSITQAQNRKVITGARAQGARVAWAIADHPWCDGSEGAEVRVTMSVLAREPAEARLVSVEYTRYITHGIAPRIVSESRVPVLNDDLTAHADVATAARNPLRAHEGLASPGFKLHGAGFILPPNEAAQLLTLDARHAEIIRPYRNGKDLTARPRGVWVIDFGLRDEAGAREYPVLYDLVRDRVKPERDANARASYGRYWWRFGEARRDLRAALAGLPRYIATVETAKHRLFMFLDAAVAPDNMLVCVASEDAFHLGVLSSSLHGAWARAAGGALEDKARYNKTVCFDPFPFPAASDSQRREIRDLAERIERHRAAALARGEKVTLTRMYNVIGALRAGRALTRAEQAVHSTAACGVVRDLHDELDSAVARAYGWQWPMPIAEILDRLVALHDARIEEEGRGEVRWLRPEYQDAQGPRPLARDRSGVATPTGEPMVRDEDPAAVWPATVIEQITLLKNSVTAPATPEQVAARFRGARRDIVARHMETLALMGELRAEPGGRYTAALGAM